MNKKLCVDCKHFHANTKDWQSQHLQERYGTCDRTAKVAPGTGTMCEIERAYPFFIFNSCGTTARFFEAKK